MKNQIFQSLDLPGFKSIVASCLYARIPRWIKIALFPADSIYSLLTQVQYNVGMILSELIGLSEFRRWWLVYLANQVWRVLNLWLVFSNLGLDAATQYGSE